MASDFTVIQAVRQRFGSVGPQVEGEDTGGEEDAPFVGDSKEYPFSCPGVDRGQPAVLLFESRGVTESTVSGNPRGIVRINGVELFGGITPGPKNVWKSHTLLVTPDVLQSENVLRIESAPLVDALVKVFDRFLIDNVVIFFKTRAQVRPGGGVLDPNPA